MMHADRLRAYARLAVRVGVNVQTEQLLVINAPVQCVPFVHLCIEEAYAAGAGEVFVRWDDEEADRLRYMYEETDVMTAFPAWRVEQEKEYVQRGYCVLHIRSSVPGMLSAVNGEKIRAVSSAQRQALKPYKDYTMSGRGQWCILAHPNTAWAQQVYPSLSPEEALEHLWEDVLECVRVTHENDPVAQWQEHNARLASNAKTLNDYAFRSLHFENSAGTDLTVELLNEHIWTGGAAHTSEQGIPFNPNMPTEEIFTTPAKFGVNGVVYATKPLDYRSQLAKDFWFRFENGRVTDYGAKSGLEAIQNLVHFDEGSAYLGEVALVSHNSPVSRHGILFLNTLFDENASCHLALGSSIPTSVRGGREMTREARTTLGANDSAEHCDFMFGSADMRITGHTQDGRTVVIFENGEFNPKASFHL